ncbi:hypothetical protein OIU85_015039 [Salix viminalis]|uniref:Uncharacterized protein n=1 Tax=Salix viminalis TaxID=40686 RepID=A0A9Q0SBZ8_SALVM|nr:hypothetical protein OIU85_015039 [Salix viminalis]
MEELARFRLVSKRCKRLCFTIPPLTFDNRTHGPIDSDRQIHKTCFLTNGWICVRLMASRFQHSISIGSSKEAILTKNFTSANGSEVKLRRIEVITRSGTAFELPVSVLKYEP